MLSSIIELKKFELQKKVRSVGISVLCAAFVAACATAPKEPKEVELGDLLEQTQTMPEEQQALVLVQADRAFRAKDYDTSMQKYSSLIAAGNEAPEIQLGYAESLLALQDLDLALVAFKKLAKSPGYEAKAAQGQGIVHARTLAMDDAKEHLQKAVELDPTLWRSWNALGQIADIEEDWVASEIAYNKALEVNPRSAATMNNLGMSALLQGRLDASLASFEKALEIDPGSEIVQRNRRLVLAMQGKYGEAIRSASPQQIARELNNVAFVAMHRGDHSEARRLLDRSIDESDIFYKKAEENLEVLDDMSGQE